MGSFAVTLTAAVVAASIGIQGFASALNTGTGSLRFRTNTHVNFAPRHKNTNRPLSLLCSTSASADRHHQRQRHGQTPKQRLNNGHQNNAILLDRQRQRQRHSSKLFMSPPKSLDEENNEESTLKKNKTINFLKRYLNMNSSVVRSTTQTEAIGQKQKRQYTIDEIEGEEEAIPPEVLRPFSLLLLSQFILFLGVGAVIPTIPLYGQSIGLSAASNGLVISAPAVALLLVSRIAGELSDKGRKGAMIGGMALIAISDVGTALSNSLATLIVARLGLGLGRGYAEAGERGMLADLANATPKLRGRALALQQASVALGIAIGAPIGGLVVEEYGARSAFLCVSAAAVFALGIYAILPETVGATEENDDNVVNVKDSFASKAAENNEADWGQLLKTSLTWQSLAIAQCGTSFGYACKIAVIPILANQYLGGATGAGLLLSAAGLAGLVGAPLGGFLSDKAGSRVAAAVSGSVSGLALVAVPLGLTLGGAMDPATTLPMLGGISAQAAAFTGFVLLWSVGASAQGPALTSLAQENAPAGSEATALGLPRAVGDGTYIVAPLILGFFSDRMGDDIPGISCMVAGGAICVGSLALSLFRRLDEND